MVWNEMDAILMRYTCRLQVRDQTDLIYYCGEKSQWWEKRPRSSVNMNGSISFDNSLLCFARPRLLLKGSIVSYFSQFWWWWLMLGQWNEIDRWRCLYRIFQMGSNVFVSCGSWSLPCPTACRLRLWLETKPQNRSGDDDASKKKREYERPIANSEVPIQISMIQILTNWMAWRILQ